MVDRKVRDEMASVVERYLGEEITAFEFDAALQGLNGSTEDATVHAVVDWLWFTYDDITDHKVVAVKEQWDWFQRLLLLLRSDAEPTWTRRRRWTVRQPIAATGVAGFAVTAVVTGLTPSLLLACVPLGCLLWALIRWRDRDERAGCEDRHIISPFASVSEMLATRRSVTGFRKRRYPGHLEDRRIRGRVTELGMWAQSLPGLFVFSPLLLLIQAFPEDDSECRVVVSCPPPTEQGG